MEIIRTKEALQQAIRALRNVGKVIGLVPTMGALHAGHRSLVEMARARADVVVMSIFVNPTQFGPHEDFARYPRSEESDIAMAQNAGVGIVYLPSVAEMYAPGATTRVQVQGIAEELCGTFRPGHFDGVATIVTKLFMQAMPDVAVFGEKDYQQLHIIRQFTRDLDIPVRILGAPILREPDGLAMSSRNRYLDEEQRAIAAMLYSTLSEVASQIRNSGFAKEIIIDTKHKLRAAGFNKIDYIELRDAETLAAITHVQKTARLLAAVWLGTTRLIDNVAVTA